MPQAEIITIGTEILLGEIADTNSRYIARTLRDAGVDIYWISTVGDNKKRIAKAIKQAMKRSEIIICTGGLGPTVDDPTREAVAAAMGVPTEFRPELWQQVVERFARYGHTPGENNRRQAFVPQGSLALENPVGTAPAFIAETSKNAIIALPGVPLEMQHLMQQAVLPYLRQRFDLSGVIKTRILHTSGAGESQIDEVIGDLEEWHNPTVGLAAHAGQVDVRITAKADSEAEAEKMIAALEAELRQRLGDRVYGADDDTLEATALGNLKGLGWRLVVMEAGLGGLLTQTLAGTQRAEFLGGQVLSGDPPTPQQLIQQCKDIMQEHGAEAGLGALLEKDENIQTLQLVVISPVKEQAITRGYGGPPLLAPHWSVNVCLDVLRRMEG